MKLKTFIILTFVLAIAVLFLVYFSNIYVAKTAVPEKVVAGIIGR